MKDDWEEIEDSENIFNCTFALINLFYVYL